MAINLRRPTEATIPDASITAQKLASGAVDLSTPVVTGSLPNSKLDVITDVNKIEDNLITLEKTSDDVRLVPLVAGEIDFESTGTTELETVETGNTKTNKFSSQKIRIVATLKTNNPTYTATMNIYADDEVTPRLVLTSTDDSDYELVTGEFDISDLGNGKHKFLAKIKSSDVSGIAYTNLIEFYGVK